MVCDGLSIPVGYYSVNIGIFIGLLRNYGWYEALPISLGKEK